MAYLLGALLAFLGLAFVVLYDIGGWALVAIIAVECIIIFALGLAAGFVVSWRR